MRVFLCHRRHHCDCLPELVAMPPTSHDDHGFEPPDPKHHPQMIGALVQTSLEWTTTIKCLVEKLKNLVKFCGFFVVLSGYCFQVRPFRLLLHHEIGVGLLRRSRYCTGTNHLLMLCETYSSNVFDARGYELPDAFSN